MSINGPVLNNLEATSGYCRQAQLQSQVVPHPTCIEMQSGLSSMMSVCCRGRLSADRSLTYFPSMYLVPSRYTLWLIVPWGSIWVIHWGW